MSEAAGAVTDSFLSQPFSIYPLLYFCPVKTGMRVLVITDHADRLDLGEGTLGVKVDFSIPRNERCGDDTLAQAGSRCIAVLPDAPSQEPYPVIIVDLEHVPASVANATIERCLQRDGSLLRLDWQVRRGALRDILRLVERTYAATRSSPRPARLCFDVDPSLRKPRYLVRRTLRQRLPATSKSGLRRWAVRAGAFYLQPHHSASVETASLRDSPLLTVIARLFPRSTSDGALIDSIRSVYISTTSALIVEVAVEDDRYFVSFPLTDTSLKRAQREERIYERVHDAIKISALPRRVKLDAQSSVPVFIETAVTGTSVERRFRSMPSSRASRYIGAALKFLWTLHAGFKRPLRFDDVAYSAYIAPRLRLIGNRLSQSGFATDGIAMLASTLKSDLRGKTCIATLCHGDFKIGNCLFTGASVTGVVDWDLAAEDELAAFDVANLIGRAVRDRARMTLSSYVLAEVEVQYLFRDELLEYWRASGADPLSEQQLRLLYWIDRVFKQIQFNEAVNDQWVRKNIEPVAAHFRRA